MDKMNFASFLLQCENFLSDIKYESFIRKELDKIHEDIDEIKNLLKDKEENNGTK